MRYNESAVRTYTLREEKCSSMSFTLWVRTLKQQLLTGILSYKRTQYIQLARIVTTHMSCSLELSFFSFCTATLTHSPPDSSVCGCAVWRRDCHPVSYWSVEEEDSLVPRPLPTHLSATQFFPGRRSHLFT